jgi:hypothetical protein
MKNVKQLLPKNISVTLLMTPCYSGGWLVQRDLTNSRKELLNATGATAVGPRTDTRSRPVSQSVGRASGSIAATAILHSLIMLRRQKQKNRRSCAIRRILSWPTRSLRP